MATQTLSSFERRLLNRLQESLPITPRPFRAVAKELRVTEERVLEGIEALKKKGIVRRLGGVFSSRDMGFKSTLVAAKVARARLGRIVGFVNSFNEVTHNYLRTHEFNLWFTLTAGSRRRITGILKAIRGQAGVERLIELPALKHYKVEVKFSV